MLEDYSKIYLMYLAERSSLPQSKIPKYKGASKKCQLSEESNITILARMKQFTYFKFKFDLFSCGRWRVDTYDGDRYVETITYLPYSHTLSHY